MFRRYYNPRKSLLPFKFRLLSYETSRTHPINRNLKPSEAISEFLGRLRDLNKSDRTIDNWRSSLLRLDKFFKKCGRSLLSAQQTDFYRFVIENSKKHDRYTHEPGKIQFSTIRAYLCKLLNFYEFCDVFGVQYTGDKKTLERMKHMRIEPPPITIPLTQKQLNSLLNELHGKIYRFIRLLTIIHIIYATGIKTSECAAYIRLYLETARPFFLQNKASQYLFVNQRGGSCYEYSKLFDYPQIDTHKVSKENLKLDPLLENYEVLKSNYSNHR